MRENEPFPTRVKKSDRKCQYCGCDLWVFIYTHKGVRQLGPIHEPDWCAWDYYKKRKRRQGEDDDR